jgi:hypothetical protein
VLLRDTEMTAEQLRTIFVSAEFKQDLEEMSSYLASIKQERPIIYCLAKYLWKGKRVFQLEDKLRDLVVHDTHLEFKYNFDCDMSRLAKELNRYGDKPLSSMWEDVQARKFSKSWSVMPTIYEDICVKKVRDRLADIFVWIICSRDLSKVSTDARRRICWSAVQCKWSEAHPYPDRTYLRAADLFLEKLRAARPFSLIQEDIATNGDFPSVYHLRLCEFTAAGI